MGIEALRPGVGNKADSKVATFTPALYDEARQSGWFVISIKSDWKRVFAFDK